MSQPQFDHKFPTFSSIHHFKTSNQRNQIRSNQIPGVFGSGLNITADQDAHAAQRRSDKCIWPQRPGWSVTYMTISDLRFPLDKALQYQKHIWGSGGRGHFKLSTQYCSIILATSSQHSLSYWSSKMAWSSPNYNHGNLVSVRLISGIHDPGVL